MINSGGLTNGNLLFNGWNTRTDGYGDIYSPGESYSMLPGDLDLHAKWSQFWFIGSTAAEANGWYFVTYGNGLFVAAASTGTNRVMTSSDGITWTPRSAAEANIWSSVTYSNGHFVAVASTGTNRVMFANWQP